MSGRSSTRAAALGPRDHWLNLLIQDNLRGSQATAAQRDRLANTSGYSIRSIRVSWR